MFLRLMALPCSFSWYAEVAVPPVGPSFLVMSCVWCVLELLLYIWVWSLASLVFSFLGLDHAFVVGVFVPCVGFLVLGSYL